MQKHVSDIRNLLWSTIVLQLGWFQNHLYVEIHQKPEVVHKNFVVRLEVLTAKLWILMSW